MCLPFSFQGRAKVSFEKIIVRNIEIFRKFWDVKGFLETFGDM